MRKRSSLALLKIAILAVAVVTGLGASAAFAGEVTGNCNHADNAEAQENCKGQEQGPGTRVSNGSSWCSFSGQNDDPNEPGPGGGNTQSWGQLVSKGAEDPSALKGTGDSPGTTCNENKRRTISGSTGIGSQEARRVSRRSP